MSSTTTSVGWDTTLAGQSWASPMPDSASTMNTSNLIERTREVAASDANDYSRFKNIGDSDSDDENAKSNTAAVKPSEGGVEACRNCHKPGAKLKCSICKKAAYCARKCQAGDWQFHKRICKKPEEKKPEPPRKQPSPSKPEASSSSSSSSASSSSAANKTTTPAPKKTTTKSSSTEVVVDEPDLPASEMRGYKNGLPYFHRELSEQEQNLIGDIAPKKVEVAPEVVLPTAHAGSAWNAAGTFEERNFTKWAEDKWRAVFTNKTYTEGSYNATLKSPDKITGDASVCVVRGKKRFLFDFNFKLPFEIVVSGTTYRGDYQMNDISNDEDYEISATWSKKPSSAAEASALHKFVSGGLKKEVVRLVGDFIREFQSQ